MSRIETNDEREAALIEQRVRLGHNARRAPQGSHWRHRKTGGVYVIDHHGLIEATLEPAVVYRPKDGTPGLVWVRPAAEFFDGRFEEVNA